MKKVLHLERNSGLCGIVEPAQDGTTSYVSVLFSQNHVGGCLGPSVACPTLNQFHCRLLFSHSCSPFTLPCVPFLKQHNHHKFLLFLLFSFFFNQMDPFFLHNVPHSKSHPHRCKTVTSLHSPKNLTHKHIKYKPLHSQNIVSFVFM